MHEHIAQHGPSAAAPGQPKLRQNTGELRHCYVCKRELSLDRFLTITQRQKRPSGKLYVYRGPSYDCRDCRNDAKRRGRQRAAEMAGRVFEARGDRAAWEAACAELRAAKEAQQRARYQAYLDEKERRMRHRRQSPMLECVRCHATKPRCEFYPSMTGNAPCRACCDASDAQRFQRARESLSDTYVKRQIAKKSGLRHAQIPETLVEAERVRLMVQRIVGPYKQPCGPQRKTKTKTKTTRKAK